MRQQKKNIIEHVKWLTQGVGGGDSIVFHYSGHGAQISVDDWTATNETDGLDEIVCSVDLDWSNPLRDHELGAYFKRVPKDCDTLVIMDCCHSGTSLRGCFGKDKLKTEDDYITKSINPPISNILSNPALIINDDLSFSFEDKKQNSKAFISKFLVDVTEQGDAILLAGCGEQQTSADAWINNRYQGAMTYALAKTLHEHSYDITYKQLIIEINSYMKKFKFDQVPQLECIPELFNNKFLK